MKEFNLKVRSLAIAIACMALSLSVKSQVVSFDVIASDMCAPATVSFRNMSGNLGAITSMTWDFGDGSPSITGDLLDNDSVSHYYQNPGTYIVTLTVMYGSVERTTTQMIIISDSPCHYYTNLSDTVVLCLPSNFSIVFSDPTAAYSINWGDGTISYVGGANPCTKRYNDNFEGIYTVLIEGTPLSGSISYDTIVVFAYTKVAASNIITVGRCDLSDPVQFQDNTTYGSLFHDFGKEQVEWFFGQGNSSAIGSTVSHTYGTYGEYIVQQLVTTPYGCVLDTVKQTIPMPFTITNYSASFCQGGFYTDVHFTDLTLAGTYYDTLQNTNACDSIVRLELSYATHPSVHQLCMISVDENNHNEIVWKNLDEVASYNIYREGNQNGQYDLVTNIDYSEPNIWVDTASNARMRSYRYKVSAMDTCGNESELSNAHKTMHLTINAGQNNSWNLIWTAYEGTEYATYNIYRATGNKNSPLTLIGTMPSGNTTYSDFTVPNGNGYLYYMVEIVLDAPCVLTKSLSSIKSNIATNDPDVGIAEWKIENGELKIYPNPAKRELRIKNEEGEIESVEIYDVVGRRLTNFQFSTFNSQLNIDVSHLANGMYFLKVDNKTVKFIKK